MPHNGTRTLMNHLGLFAREQGLTGAGEWWHFGDHEHLVAQHRPHLHIPIRHPMDVARSWALRDKKGDALREMCNRYHAMFALLGHAHTLHQVEWLPRTHGTGEHDPDKPERRVAQFQEALADEIVVPNIDFFEPFYEAPCDGAGFLH